VTVSAPPRAHARRRERCPNCDLPAQRGQLICLSCGTRMALERSASDKRAVAAAAGAMALVALVSLVFVLDAVNGGGERSAASAAAQERAQAKPQANPPVRAETALWKLKADSSRRAAMSGGHWPVGQTGWTVVLSTMYDEEGADSFAQDVRASGVDAGVLAAEDFPALGTTGVWYVYSGVYADELEAGEAAAELAATYSGAFTQYVE
jgi:hypothetical protein